MCNVVHTRCDLSYAKETLFCHSCCHFSAQGSALKKVWHVSLSEFSDKLETYTFSILQKTQQWCFHGPDVSLFWLVVLPA